MAAALVSAYVAWKALRVAMGAHLGHELADVVREVGAVAIVLWAVPAAMSWVGDASHVEWLWGEAYDRTLTAANCLANVRLSGPLSAYSSLVEARLAPYTAVYGQALWQLSMLAGIWRVLEGWGLAALSAAIAMYAAWLRPLGGAVAGAILALWVGLNAYAGWTAGLGIADTPRMEWRPVDAVATHCDEQLAGLYAGDYDAWRAAVAGAWLYMFLAPVLGAALGTLMGKH